jgi:hypothetical protein
MVSKNKKTLKKRQGRRKSVKGGDGIMSSWPWPFSIFSKKTEPPEDVKTDEPAPAEPVNPAPAEPVNPTLAEPDNKAPVATQGGWRHDKKKAKEHSVSANRNKSKSVTRSRSRRH